jgi:hypothetical protein
MDSVNQPTSSPETPYSATQGVAYTSKKNN